MADFDAASLIAGRYRLEHRLGEGGMGAVWVAEDETLQRWVAIKLMTARLAASSSAAERFEREAMAIARVRSPHVVQVFDYGVDNDTAFMVMELLHGEDLYSWLRKHRPVPLERVAELVVQVAKGLTAAHRVGIVHRDLKPANVFVVREHEEECVKVFDFGLAKGLADLGPMRDQTGEGVLLGTPRYMSPEQAHGAKRVDHRGDLWSLGVIAYLAITGRLPFRGNGVGEVITKIATEAPVPPSELVETLPDTVDGFFLRALAKRPEDRFQSAQELSDAFVALGSEGVTSSTFGGGDGDTVLDHTAADADVDTWSPEAAPPPVERPAGDGDEVGHAERGDLPPHPPSKPRRRPVGRARRREWRTFVTMMLLAAGVAIVSLSLRREERPQALASGALSVVGAAAQVAVPAGVATASPSSTEERGEIGSESTPAPPAGATTAVSLGKAGVPYRVGAPTRDPAGRSANDVGDGGDDGAPPDADDREEQLDHFKDRH